MAGPTYNTSAGVDTNGTGSVSPAFPSTVTSGQVAILVVTSLGNDGYELDTGSFLDWSNVSSVGRTGRSMRVWYRICDGTEDNATQTVTSSGSLNIMGEIHLFDGARTSSTPIEDAGTANGNTGPATSTSTTTAGTDRLGVRIFAVPGFSGSTPSGWTNQSSTSGFAGAVRIDTKAIATATTEAATSRNISAGTDWGVIDFALLPPTTAVTPTKFSNTSVFFAPTVAAAANNLTHTKFSNTSSFFTPAVVGGNVALIATPFTNTSTFGTPLVAGDGYVLPALFANASTFGTPVVASIAASQNLLPGLFINTSVFGSQVVSRPGSGERYTLRGQGSKVRLRGRP